jgi:hypothetical protein
VTARLSSRVALAGLVLGWLAAPAQAFPSKKDLAGEPVSSDQEADGPASEQQAGEIGEREAAASAAERESQRDAWQKQLAKRIGKPPPPVINVFNTWTHEYLVFDAGYRGPVAAEVGMQNSGLAVALASQFFTATAALPGAVFSIWHNLSGSALAGWWSRNPPRVAGDNDVH